MLTSQRLTNDEGHPNDDVSSWVSKMLFRLSGYHHQWDLSNQIIHITLVSIFCIAWVPKSLTFLQVRNTVVSYQNECFSSKSELPCLPPSSLELWRRERASKQLSFWWKTLILIGHYGISSFTSPNFADFNGNGLFWFYKILNFLMINTTRPNPITISNQSNALVQFACAY